MLCYVDLPNVLKIYIFFLWRRLNSGILNLVNRFSLCEKGLWTSTQNETPFLFPTAKWVWDTVSARNNH